VIFDFDISDIFIKHQVVWTTYPNEHLYSPRMAAVIKRRKK